jgi:hypothetical protein
MGHEPMTAHLDATVRQIAAHSRAFADDERAFLGTVAWVEAGLIRCTRLLAGDPEFPVDLRVRMVADMASRRVDAPGAGGAAALGYARRWRRSLLVERLRLHFEELGERRLASRFGGWTSDPTDCLGRRSEWEEQHATHYGAAESLCGRSLIDGIPPTQDPASVSCWLCQLKLQANRWRAL